MQRRHVCLFAAWSALAAGKLAFDLEEIPSPSTTPALKISVATCATAAGLNLVQTAAISFSTSRIRSKTLLTDNLADNLTVNAQAAAAASLEAARMAAEATVEVMNRNRELQLENAHLREEGRISNSSVGLLMAHMVVRSVPRHRFKQYNEIAIQVDYNNLYEEMFTFPKRRPWTTNVVIATLKTFLADLVVQLTSSKDGSGERRYDWRRGILFTVFGFLYVGMAQWFFYVSMFSRILPESTSFANKPFGLKLLDKIGQEDLLIQVVVDQFMITPLVYFPIFYVLKEVLNQRLREDESKVQTTGPVFQLAMSNYAKNFRTDNLASMAIWFPADFVIFMAPMYMRMPLDHGVAFLWTMILSYMRGVAK